MKGLHCYRKPEAAYEQQHTEQHKPLFQPFFRKRRKSFSIAGTCQCRCVPEYCKTYLRTAVLMVTSSDIVINNNALATSCILQIFLLKEERTSEYHTCQPLNIKIC